ncbi:uncharacterized protein BDW43DRAFT_72400 [Aspergillus alliaceus]|uniref:uncharacterized protein n=1 Tax=Petromyces alliaceus TaxID=209559 RepID=UPI0012A6F73F|nr:uncharacterized protein BDW43DRAFT_72400 [Aspergillus alliaceus]KAB8238991.1 hypothetical protein BDW43DRAFT_72400 [Aspergillus alliaceus]
MCALNGSNVLIILDLCSKALPNDSQYVALKIYLAGKAGKKPQVEHLRLDPLHGDDHPGKSCICKLLTHFSNKGPKGQYLCLVHGPLDISANDVSKWILGRMMALEGMKACIRQLLIGLGFLHSVPRVIDTDLQPNNLLMPAPDKTALASFEEKENKSPSPKKIFQRAENLYLAILPMTQWDTPFK